MKRALLIIVGALVVVAVAALLWRSVVTEKTGGEDRALELLTIMGTAPLEDAPTQGRWSSPEAGTPVFELDDEERERLEALHALPYMGGSTEAPDEINVTLYDETSAYDGVNLYNSGHGPEALAVDMNGRVLHRWRFPIEDVWPDVPETPHGTFWRRVYWYPNGDILAIFEGIGMIKLDRQSNLIWSYRHPCHHAVTVDEDGKIYVLTREPATDPDIARGETILEDSFDILNSKGKRISRHSVLEAVKSSNVANVLKAIRHGGDILHTNSIYVFDGSIEKMSPAYKKGNVLVSILNINLIAIIEPGIDKIVWSRLGAGSRLWVSQHEPVPLANGNLLVFDNRGNNNQSRVIEVNPYNLRIVWQYDGTEDRPLFSQTCGTNQPLPNGNILITESDRGRAIEVTRDGVIVWEFYNPHRAGDSNQLIATLFEVKRVGRDYFPWIEDDRQ